jgi:two-component system, OmpR family, response regulator MprA
LTRLLVADDSETVLLMLERRLEMEGYDVVTATDGFEALEALRSTDSQDPDVILLDAMMPNMSGIEVLEQLRESGSKIPVLMISAHLDAQEPDRMRSLGASDCIPKPFEWEELIGKIEELAGNSDSQGGSNSEEPAPSSD